MEDIPDTYNLETLEQLRAVADDLRLRILEQLAQQPMTVTQLAGVLGEVPAKLHYHVHELDKVGLLKLVETREKGGILEKYYRAVAKNISAPRPLFRGIPPDEAAAAVNEILQPFFQGVIQTAQRLLRAQTWDNPDQVMYLALEHYWMTADEFAQVNKQIEALMYVLGACTFADDIPPDLVERAVHSFHLRGKLTASPEVREVLKRKGGEPGKK